MRLLNRNARSVTLTQMGEELLARLGSWFGEISDGLEALNRLGSLCTRTGFDA